MLNAIVQCCVIVSYTALNISVSLDAIRNEDREVLRNRVQWSFWATCVNHDFVNLVPSYESPNHEFHAAYGLFVSQRDGQCLPWINTLKYVKAYMELCNISKWMFLKQYF